jgi:hypothetical protein
MSALPALNALPRTNLWAVGLRGYIEEPGRSNERQTYSSFFHWYEAAKFSAGEARTEVLLTPNWFDAIKVSARNKKQWRIDWPGVRTRVALTGLNWMRHEAEILGEGPMSPDALLEGLDSQRPFKQGEPLTKWLRQLVSNPLPEQPWLAVFGEDAAEPDRVGRAVARILEKVPDMGLLQWHGRGASRQIHEHFRHELRPVQYAGNGRDPMGSEAVADLAGRATHMLEFKKPGDMRFAAASTVAKRRGIAIATIALR